MSERLRTYKNKGRDLAVSGPVVHDTRMTCDTVTVAWFNATMVQNVCVHSDAPFIAWRQIVSRWSTRVSPTTICRTCGTEGQRSQWSCERWVKSMRPEAVSNTSSPPLESQRWATIETSEHSCGEGWYSYYFLSLGWNCKGIATVLSLCLSLLSLSTLLSLSLQKAQSANPEEQFGAVQSARYASYFWVCGGRGGTRQHPWCVLDLWLCTLFEKLNVASPPVTTSCINSTDVLTAKSQPMTRLVLESCAQSSRKSLIHTCWGPTCLDNWNNMRVNALQILSFDAQQNIYKCFAVLDKWLSARLVQRR